MRRFFSERPGRKAVRDRAAGYDESAPASRRATPGAGLLHRSEAARPAKDKGPILSNGAALYHDSAIPWEIEAAAREAMEESLKS